MYSRPLVVTPLAGWNVRGYSYGEKTPTGLHPGADLNVGLGDQDLGLPVTAVADGAVVTRRAWDGVSYGYGNVLLIAHTLFARPDAASLSDGVRLWSLYAHLDAFEPDVAEGATVTAGQRIGTCGKTGLQKWAHLHFELRYQGPPDMPLDYPTGHITVDRLSDQFADPYSVLRVLAEASYASDSDLVRSLAALQADRDFNFALKMEFEHYLRSTRLYTRAGSRFIRADGAADRLIATVVNR